MILYKFGHAALLWRYFFAVPIMADAVVTVVLGWAFVQSRQAQSQVERIVFTN